MVSHTLLTARRMYRLQRMSSQEKYVMLSLDVWQSRRHCVKMVGYGGPWPRHSWPLRLCTVGKQMNHRHPAPWGQAGPFRHPRHSHEATKLLLPPKLRFTLDPLQSGGVTSLAIAQAHGAHTKLPQSLGARDPSGGEGRDVDQLAHG